jgi:hypothetical protein
MSNETNKSTVEQLAIALYENGFLQGDGDGIQEIVEIFKEIEKERMIELLEWMNSVNQFDPMRLETDNDDIVEQYYNETYGGNK